MLYIPPDLWQNENRYPYCISMRKENSMIAEHDYPILEYSTEDRAIINPSGSETPFPRLCLHRFWKNTLVK